MSGSNAPIGVFDSGVGGLTVLRAIHARLPAESTLYLGDSARMPYGAKSAETVTRYALAAARFLTGHGIKALVVACSTASSVALPALRQALSIPVLGVVEAGAARALRLRRGGLVAVAATEATVRSDAYARALRERDPAVEVLSRACPLFAPLVEEGSVDGHLADVVVEHHLGTLRGQNVDALILGCTHYPLLKGAIARVLGPAVAIVDGSDDVADDLDRLLGGLGAKAPGPGPGTRRYFTTDAADRLKALGTRFLGAPIDQVDVVDL